MTRDDHLPDGADLTHEAVQELLAQDGLASAEVVAALAARGIDADRLRNGWHRIRALMLPLTDAPDLVPMVFDTLELGRIDASAALLDGAGVAPELSAAVMGAVDLTFIASHDALMEGSGQAPELSEGVLHDVDLAVTRSRDALLADSGQAPELSEPVLSDLDLSVTRSRDALLADSGQAPELSEDVLHDVELAATHSRDALLADSGAAPELSAEVLAQLEQDADLGLRGLLLDTAGPAPDLAAGIFDELGLAPAQAPTPVVPLHPENDAVVPLQAPVAPAPSRRRWLWAVPAVALPAVAMAAAALIMVMSAVVAPLGGTSLSTDEFGFSPDVVNRIEIEEISAATDAIVHVIQGDIDDDAAPTIIFIDVLEDDTEEVESGDGGTTL